jgi:5-formyltetrahydrofolate cyclo-ligase
MSEARLEYDEVTSIQERKRRLRRSMLAMRRGLSDAERLAHSWQIWKRLTELSCYQHARVMLGYMAFDHEVLTDGLMRQVIESGRQLVLPIVQSDRQGMELYIVEDLDHDLAPGYRGILEPQPQPRRAVAPNTIELALVPGVAFDLRGGRLGFGVGFYDRLLSQLRSDIGTVGLGFDFQIIPRLPSEPHDIMLDAIVTELRLIWGRCWADGGEAAVTRSCNVVGGRGEV